MHLLTHIQSHPPVDELKCSFKNYNTNTSTCLKTFANLELLHSHLANEHYRGVFKCSFENCNFKRSYRSTVYNHYKEAHLSLLSSPGSKRSRSEHEKHHQPGRSSSSKSKNSNCLEEKSETKVYEENLFMCLHDNCTKMYNCYDDLIKHLKLVHDLLPKLCPLFDQCGKSFYSS